jgi:hypothetical protein
MLTVLPSVLVLGLAALAALLLVLGRGSPPESGEERLAAARVLALAVVVQGIHFAEEAATGFHDRLGPLFGVPGMPFSLFVVFNLVWLGIWIVSVPGLQALHPVAFFAAWFLAIAGMFNGIAHPLLAVAAGEYFPGLVSSPIIGIVSIWLLLRLRAATQPRGAPAVRRDPSGR